MSESDRRQQKLPGLDADKVEIVRVPVYIYRMRVGKKNLTLSMVRQMRPTKLVDEERVELLGEPLYFVYYDPGGPKLPDHTQFIARFGKHLRRCPVRIRHLEGYPSDRERPCEDGWPEPLLAMRSRHERLSLFALIDSAIQGRPGPHETFDCRNPRLAYPPRPPFAAGSVKLDEFDEDLAWRIEGAIDPGPDIAIPPSPTKRVVSARDRRHIPWPTPDPGKPDPPAMPPRPTWVVSAAEAQRECRDRLGQFLTSHGITPGQPPEHWESLIAGNAADASDYIERWNALMDELLDVEQIYA